jgi:hypothetical protein
MPYLQRIIIDTARAILVAIMCLWLFNARLLPQALAVLIVLDCAARVVITSVVTLHGIWTDRGNYQ